MANNLQRAEVTGRIVGGIIANKKLNDLGKGVFSGGIKSGFSQEKVVGEGVKKAVEKETSLTANIFKGEFLHNLESLNENKIKHILEGSANSNHKWEKLVSNKNWDDIKKIIKDVMETGKEGTYKTNAMCRTKIINGEKVEVIYKVIDGTARISNAWIV